MNLISTGKSVPRLMAFCLAGLLSIINGMFLGLSAQPLDPRFGEISRADLDSARARRDTTAEAIVLYNFARVTFSSRGSDVWMDERIHRRVYIQKKAGYDRATVRLPLYRNEVGKQEVITDIRGLTHNWVADQLASDKLGRDAVFTDRAADELTIKKFTLPNVREGSIIEYAYTRSTPFSLNYNPSSWSFQESVPVLWSEYQIDIPDALYYKMIMGGYLPLHINEKKSANVVLVKGDSGHGTAYRFVVKNAPAFHDEPYITTESDYLSRIEFELASYTPAYAPVRNFSLNWHDLDKTLLSRSDFGGQLNRAGFLKEAVALAKAQKDTLARLTAAYDYLRKTIKWNGRPNVVSGGSKKIFESREGDAADINLMLVALLRELDFDANPVILSTRSNGKVSEVYALLRQFNYVVAHVELPGGRSLLLDATDAHLKPGMLPDHCLNGTGRLIHPKAGRFVSLKPTERDVENSVASFTLTPDGDLKGTFRITSGGYSAWEGRKILAETTPEKYLEAVRKSRPAWQITKSDIRHADNLNEALTFEYALDMPEACMVAGDRLYLKPMLTEGLAANPFKAVERLFPVDFGKERDESYFAQITLPEGYEVEQLPKPAVVSLPDNGGRFVFQATVSNNVLSVVSRLTLRKPLYFSEEYSSLREFYDHIVAKHAEQVVLTRSKTTASK